MMKKPIGKLCVITDVTIQSRFNHLQLAELACQGGADMIQLRDKTATTRELFALAVAMQAICSAYGKVFIVNDRVDIALLANADGVHLGQTDLPISAARKILGNDKIIGGTASSLLEAIQVQRDGADYIGFGHIFTTNTKEKKKSPIGVSVLSEIIAQINIPMMAIGGISEKNISEVIQTQVHSIAVVSAVCQSENPKEATSGLVKLMNKNFH